MSKQVYRDVTDRQWGPWQLLFDMSAFFEQAVLIFTFRTFALIIPIFDIMSAIARWIHFPPSVWFQCSKSLAPWGPRLTDFYHPLTRKFMSNLQFAGLKWPLCSWNGHSPTLQKFYNWPVCHLYWNGNSLLFLLVNKKTEHLTLNPESLFVSLLSASWQPIAHLFCLTFSKHTFCTFLPSVKTEQ